ncbi:sensor histidine kinase [Streptomyces griseus]|uniref:sensor histidine kinase n=1 Tax=Streptomyces griseus TaxID=1911 RepID=UPI0008498BDB|nr:sensor histidine kinase [Streptomyces griseus]
MQRLYDFIRRHPTGVDVFWAVFLLGLSGVSMVSGMYDAGREEIVAVPVALGLSTVVALRRRAPEKMLLLAILVGLVQLVFDVRPGIGDFAMLVITYTVATIGERWASRLALVCSLSAAALSQLRWEAEPGGSWAQVVFVTIIMTVPFVLAWVLGDSLRTRRAYFDQLEERAARLEREREAQSKVAVAAERARIARELHDVVAHNVSVMVVQADGAAYVMDAAPDQARQALETISSTGRQALAEMRRLLGVLRTGDAPESGEYVPQPDVEQIEDLVAQVRQTGLTVDFKVEGTPRPLPSGVELTAYRVVQEALTNTLKHATGPTSATVTLTCSHTHLDARITDTGTGAGPAVDAEDAVPPTQGIMGMRERAALYDGTVEAGPLPNGGGWQIRLRLPLEDTPP